MSSPKNINIKPLEEFFDSIDKDKALEHLEWVIKVYTEKMLESEYHSSEEFTTLFDLYLAIKAA